jgi:DNA adenine methylase
MKHRKPLIKWVGGKTQIIDTVMELFPKEIINYHELFVGGGSVLIALLEAINANHINVTGKIYAYDINETLINFYVNIQKRVAKVIKEVNNLLEIFGQLIEKKMVQKPLCEDDAYESQESYYYWVRHTFNNFTQLQKNSAMGSAHFLFLNKTCFRGIHREGPNGFNVPYGNYHDPEIMNDTHMKYISTLLQPVKFICSSFEQSYQLVSDKDFCYLDPPYVPVDEKSFVKYNQSGFTLEQHKTLFTMCKRTKFLLSNSDTSLVHKYFKHYKHKIILCKRAINCKKPNAIVNEILVYN